MSRKELPDPVSKCPICTINLYGTEVLNLKSTVISKITGELLTIDKSIKTEKGQKHTVVNGKPMVFPCGIYREKQGRCPWETEQQQKDLTIVHDYEKIAGLLGTMHTNE